MSTQQKMKHTRFIFRCLLYWKVKLLLLFYPRIMILIIDSFKTLIMLSKIRSSAHYILYRSLYKLISTIQIKGKHLQNHLMWSRFGVKIYVRTHHGFSYIIHKKQKALYYIMKYQSTLSTTDYVNERF